MDNNGVNASISNPGEGIADIHAILRLQDSCMGRGFFKTGNCGGYGDPCTACTGIRDARLGQAPVRRPARPRLDQLPTAPAGSGPCGREVHCEGYVVAEAAWDLFARDFQGSAVLLRQQHGPGAHDAAVLPGQPARDQLVPVHAAFRRLQR